MGKWTRRQSMALGKQSRRLSESTGLDICTVRSRLAAFLGAHGYFPRDAAFTAALERHGGKEMPVRWWE